MIATFVEERERRFPDSGQMFRLAKGYLVLGHHACELAISQLFASGDPDTQRLWTPYANALLVSPFRNMQILFCLQQLQLTNSIFTPNADFSAGWASLMAEGACDLYSQPWGIVQELTRRVAERPEADPRMRFMNCADRMQHELIGYEGTIMTDMMLRDMVGRIFVDMASVGKEDKEQIVRLSTTLLAQM